MKQNANSFFVYSTSYISHESNGCKSCENIFWGYLKQTKNEEERERAESPNKASHSLRRNTFNSFQIHFYEIVEHAINLKEINISSPIYNDIFLFLIFNY